MSENELVFAVLQDGRLRVGDHIVQIGNRTAVGMDVSQVVPLLRDSGAVRLVVVRPLEVSQIRSGSSLPVFPTVELERHLQTLGSLLDAGVDWHVASSDDAVVHALRETDGPEAVGFVDVTLPADVITSQIVFSWYSLRDDSHNCTYGVRSSRTVMLDCQLCSTVRQ